MNISWYVACICVPGSNLGLPEEEARLILT